MQTLTKDKIRQWILKERKKIAADIKVQWDQILHDALREAVLKHKPETVHCYLPMPGEIDLTSFLEYCLRTQITTVVPKVKRKPFLEHLLLTDLDELESGPMGTRHPKNAELYAGSIDLIVVPGLAFDQRGYRIGYGGAFYDHFLMNYPEAFKLAVCYPFQLYSALPHEQHDIPVDHIFCPQYKNKLKFDWEKVSFV